jgi:UDP-N-acetylmuramate--alanine ligase
MNQWRRLYFAGIGGIGISGLAQFFHARGIEISGYDKTPTPLTAELEALGMAITYEPNPESAALLRADAVIYTPAVGEDFAELVAARTAGIPTLKRARVLGLISDAYYTVAVAGTHGKTTTSSMITWLLKQSGVDCTAFVGGLTANFNSNYIPGGSRVLVCEADEYDRSFLQLRPDVAVLTSLDPDHLDIYGSHATMQESYQAFVNQIKPGGVLLLHESLAGQITVPDRVTLLTYGMGRGDVAALNPAVHQQGHRFDWAFSGGILPEMFLPMAGTHNVQNATAALGAALASGAPAEGLRAALASYRGVKRRFELLLHSPKLSLVDDYAHHPTEIEAAIAAARRHFPGRRLVVAFQPHLYSRTRDFAEGFGQALSQADVLLLIHIYPAREAPLEGIGRKTIAKHVDGPQLHLISLNELPEALFGTLTDTPNALPAVVLTLGAGDIDTQLQALTATLRPLC